MMEHPGLKWESGEGSPHSRPSLLWISRDGCVVCVSRVGLDVPEMLDGNRDLTESPTNLGLERHGIAFACDLADKLRAKDGLVVCSPSSPSELINFLGVAGFQRGQCVSGVDAHAAARVCRAVLARDETMAIDSAIADRKHRVGVVSSRIEFVSCLLD
ncbi:MAG: hypothetical protein M2R45_04370 [Verrucomicrobia subdivision 3 bacterium]|nr:hypothetical protein [Limisphaerales bacterium]MCS1416075.1 hypothetical protein [Limisphaerales bacterium]